MSDEVVTTEKKVWWAVLLERSIADGPVNALLNVAMFAGSMGYTRIAHNYGRVDMIRSKIVETFRKESKNPTDTLIMLDNDHAHPIDILKSLADHNEGVVGALAFTRGEPYFPCAFIRAGDDKLHPIADWQSGLYPVQAIGHAAIAIQRWVFDELERQNLLQPFWRYIYKDGTLDLPSEDMYFCKLLEQAHIPIYCDTSIISPHMTAAWIDDDSFLMYRNDHKELQGVISKQIEPCKIGLLSVILPTRGRADQLVKCLKQAHATLCGQPVEYIVIYDEDDQETFDALYNLDLPIIKVSTPAWTAPSEKWNRGAAIASGDALMLAADDLWFTEGWFEKAAEGYKAGFVGLADGYTNEAKGGYSTHFIASRQLLIDRFGGVLVPPCYRSQFVDVEMSVRAKRYGVYLYAPDALVEHRHWIAGKAAKDETYNHGFSEYYRSDEAMFKRREALGFPNDYEAVIK